MLAGVVTTGLVAGGCGTAQVRDAPSADPVVRRAQADVAARALSSPGGYRGPASGPRARRGGLVVFVAGDLTNGGIAGVALGVQEAARAIGWEMQILDGHGSTAGQASVLGAALRLRPAGIVLGGFDAAAQKLALERAHALGIPVVGWHAGTRPGPDRRAGLFTNVSTSPASVARLAADYAIAHSRGTAHVVIFTDRRYPIAAYKADVMAAEIRRCARCAVLDIVDAPIDLAQQQMPAVVSSLLPRFGARFQYMLAINGIYIGGALAAFVNAGRRGNDPPFAIGAGDGDASDFERIRSENHQTASIAEPLYLQGWQIVDELNRARAGQPPSLYIAPPRLITRADVPDGVVFDPPSGYRAVYLRIWGR
ncbi:MAG: ribose transport system substrate-binding protein [Solirubrobacteraceae bacterium]|nr:ribose transport system substrate-binding protein [Solirubrobacteraceae bacterium]